MSKHRLVDGSIKEIDDGIDEEPMERSRFGGFQVPYHEEDPYLKAYADRLDAMTREELIEHQRMIAAAGQLQDMMTEGLEP